MNTAALFARERLGAQVQQAYEEELLEGEPLPTAHRLGERRGTVHHAERVTNARHSCRREYLVRQILTNERKQGIEMLLDNRADDLERETICSRVHRQHSSFPRSTLIVAEVDELARLELAAVEKANGASYEKRVAL